MPSAIVGAAGVIGTVIGARQQSKALKKARKGQDALQGRLVDLQERAFDLAEIDTLAAQEVFDTLQQEAGRSSENVARTLFQNSSRIAGERLAATGNNFGARAPEVYGNLGLNAQVQAEQLRDNRLQTVGALRSGNAARLNQLGSSFTGPISQASANSSNLTLQRGALRGQTAFSIFDQLGGLAGGLGKSFGGSVFDDINRADNEVEIADVPYNR